MGTTSTTVTLNWTAVTEATVSGDEVTTSITPDMQGEAWSDIELMDAIPDGATITDLTFSLTVQVDGSRKSPSIPINPDLNFIDKAQYLAGTWSFALGRFAAGGVGALPDDNDAHDITYVNSVYTVDSGGSGVSSGNMAAFVAALSSSSSPMILQVLGPVQGTSGTTLTYSGPMTLTVSWETTDVVTLDCDTDTGLDLSTAVFLDNSGTLSGQYVDGVICTTSDFLQPDFYFPGLTLDATKAYKVTVTFDPDSSHNTGSSREVYIAGLRSGHEQDDVDAAYTAGGEWSGAVAVFYDTGFSATGDTQTFIMGPGRPQGDPVDPVPTWDDDTLGVAAGYTVPWFETDVNGAVSAISIRKLCTFTIPPLRQYPRSDGLGASSAKRVYPPAPSIQASNRRAGGYL